MKWCALILTLLLVRPGHAEEVEPIEIGEQMDVAKAQLGAGVALTLVAVALGAASGGILGTDHGTNETAAHSGALALGASSAVLAVIGVPLSVVGGKRLKDLKKRQLAVGATSLRFSF